MTTNPTQLLDRIEAAIAQEEAQAAAATKRPWKRDPCQMSTLQVIASGNEVVVYHGKHPRQNDERVVDNHDFICSRANSADADYAYYRAQVAAIRGRLMGSGEPGDDGSDERRVVEHAIAHGSTTGKATLALHDAALADLRLLAQRWLSDEAGV